MLPGYVTHGRHSALWQHREGSDRKVGYTITLEGVAGRGLAWRAVGLGSPCRALSAPGSGGVVWTGRVGWLRKQILLLATPSQLTVRDVCSWSPACSCLEDGVCLGLGRDSCSLQDDSNTSAPSEVAV